MREISNRLAAPADAYRPDIDGLRAVSILAVIANHVWPGAVPGGFAGVDVFFVISGFLISGIILRSLKAGTFGYASFYARRIKRIFPALAVVLAVSLAAGWMFFFADEWRSLGKHVFAGAAFLSNIVLMREGGYFDAHTKLLLHLWSLGIEEQFYIAWPLLLAGAWKRRLNPLWPIVVISLASFGFELLSVARHPSLAFYFPGARFWELGVGALLAYFTTFPKRTGFSRLRCPETLLSTCGIALLLASILCIDENRVFPGAWALLPTAGAALTVLAGPAAWWNRVMLSSRPMVFIGIVSYPLYLWHWPALVLARVLSRRDPSPQLLLVVLLVSAALSILTYKFVERPIRYSRSTVVAPICLLGVVGILGAVGLAAHGNLLPAPRIQPGSEAYLAAALDWEYPFDWNLKKSSGFRSGSVGPDTESQVLFIGDSQAEQYYSRVKLLEQRRPEVSQTIFLTSGGCPPFPGVERAEPGFACNSFLKYALTQAERSSVDTIVFAAYWEQYFGFVPDTFKPPPMRLVPSNVAPTAPSASFNDTVIDRFGAMITSLAARQKRIFVILSPPTSLSYDPKHCISRLTGGIEASATRPIPARTLPIVERLRAAATRAGAEVIDPIPYLCPGGLCPAPVEGGMPIYKDAKHPRSSYTALHATFIDRIYGR
jgi:peptidoglycan/LPS O-acetylase OafA/YrhL